LSDEKDFFSQRFLLFEILCHITEGAAGKPIAREPISLFDGF